MPIYSVELNGAPIDIEAPTPEDAARRAAPTVGGNACPNTPCRSCSGWVAGRLRLPGEPQRKPKHRRSARLLTFRPILASRPARSPPVSASPAQRGAVGRPPPGGESRPARRAGAQDLGPRWNSGNRG